MKRTIWESIYLDHEKTGRKWASLGDPIHPSFLFFIKRAGFNRKSVLDLGCGNGKYLKFLQTAGFATAGIDSSSTAVKLAKKLLGKKSGVHTADIYKTNIATRRYDLVISIATIQHAEKNTIKKLIDRIYRSLLPEGKVFITFPRTSSLKRWATFGKTKQIAPGTYIPLLGPEKGLPHSFYGKDELQKLFLKFKNVKIARDDMGRWIVTACR